MHTQFKYFNVEKVNGLAKVIINRESKANALNHEAWLELGLVFKALSELEDISVVMLMGEGKNFSAGMDLSTLMEIPSKWDGDCEARKRLQIQAFIKEIQQSISQIEECRWPVIACVHGACIGGAMSILTACDMAFCSRDAYFSIRETDLGIVADIGVLQRMPMWVNPSMLSELAYTARKFDAKEASEMGLVNKVYDSKDTLLDKVTETADDMASKSPLVISGIKKILKYKRNHSVEESLDYVSTWNAAYLLSEDLNRAMMAYMNKSKPNFRS